MEPKKKHALVRTIVRKGFSSLNDKKSETPNLLIGIILFGFSKNVNLPEFIKSGVEELSFQFAAEGFRRVRE